MADCSQLILLFSFNFPPLCTDPMSHLSISCVLTLQALVGVKIFYNFINHHSMALIRIFIVLTWNPSDSIYFFPGFESFSYFWALGLGNVWNLWKALNFWVLYLSFKFFDVGNWLIWFCHAENIHKMTTIFT